MQRSVLRGGSSTIASVGSQSTHADFAMVENVNVHGLRIELIGVGSLANVCNDMLYAVYVLPESLTPPSISQATINSDDIYADLLWMAGRCFVYGANAQTMPCVLNPSTSRNIPRGSRIVIVIKYEQTIAGAANTLDVRSLIRWFETAI